MTVATEKPKQKQTFRKPAPVCPEHGVAMVVGSTRTHVRYYYCPVAGCSQSRQQLRRDLEF